MEELIELREQILDKKEIAKNVAYFYLHENSLQDYHYWMHLIIAYDNVIEIIDEKLKYYQ